MLKILVVEDEPILAVTLKHHIELNPRFEVTHLADDFDSALAAVEERRPDLSLVDLQLARGSTGFSVADPEGNLWSFGTYRGEPLPE